MAMFRLLFAGAALIGKVGTVSFVGIEGGLVASKWDEMIILYILQYVYGLISEILVHERIRRKYGNIKWVMAFSMSADDFHKATKSYIKSRANGIEEGVRKIKRRYVYINPPRSPDVE
ncbi:hypothetical protein HDV00_000502 [Rhizophlyctis rosea]|nr:hypothetical protein HDV00_000502 [Rhizophlyctis rosea]